MTSKQLRWAVVNAWTDYLLEVHLNVWAEGFDNIVDAEKYRHKMLSELPLLEPNNFQIIQYYVEY